ncbi:MAG: glycosyltransferase family 2 protein [Chryseolinea sp.]
MQNSERPFFSVIMTTFNAESTLERALDSIVSQTFRDIELIIVDGMSSDGTVTILDRYSSSISKYIREPDKGVYDAMNKGIDASSGEWLYFLGADDWLFSTSVLEEVFRRVQTIADPLVYGNVKIVGDAKWARDGSVYDGEFDVSKLFKKNICHQCIFYSRRLFEEFGRFNINYKVCADWDFNHRCIAKVTSMYIDQIVANFSGGGSSSGGRGDQYSKNDSVLKLKEYYDIKFTDRLFSTYSNAFVSNFHRSVSRGELVSALRFLFLSLFHSKRKLSTVRRIIKGGLPDRA